VSLFASPAWETLTYWSLDLETGGLDAKRDAILEVGMVPIRDGVVRIGEAYASRVRPEPSAAVSARAVTVHGLTPAELAHAPPLGEVLDAVDARLREGVLLVHHASIDEAFLRRAYKEHRRAWPKPVVVDTANLLFSLHARRSFLDPERAPGDPELNLTAARRALGLPDYPSHDALSDAVATAELFLVVRHRLGARRLRDLR
jgi:DNA polymerase III subunit epsilon